MKTKAAVTPGPIYALRGQKGEVDRWIEIKEEGVDFNLVQLNLYAAAPDLLAGLKAAIEDLEPLLHEVDSRGLSTAPDSQLFKRLAWYKAAIAKAEGRGS